MPNDATGECDVQALDLETPPLRRRTGRTDADRLSISHVMTTPVVSARPMLAVSDVVSLMMRHRIGCIPVVDDARRPVGMITKFDIVEQLDVFMRSATDGSPLPADLVARTADEIMMPLALTLSEHATIAHAAVFMTLEDLHHVAVVDDRGRLVGVVSTKDITTWLVQNDHLVAREPAP